MSGHAAAAQENGAADREQDPYRRLRKAIRNRSAALVHVRSGVLRQVLTISTIPILPPRAGDRSSLTPNNSQSFAATCGENAQDHTNPRPTSGRPAAVTQRKVNQCPLLVAPQLRGITELGPSRNRISARSAQLRRTFDVDAAVSVLSIFARPISRSQPRLALALPRKSVAADPMRNQRVQ